MLKGDFFKVLTFASEGESLKVLIELNPDHNIFKGHFPGTPVVPGVCMVQMLKEMVELHFDKELLLSKAHSIKFLSVIEPGLNMMVKIDIGYKVTSDAVDVNASISAEDRVCFKFKGFFITPEEQPVLKKKL